MADKIQPSAPRDEYRLERRAAGAHSFDDNAEVSWLDGLPHDFKGWGPQTPDPDAAEAEGASFKPEETLTWAGEGDAHNHHVWRFDGRRRHHH